MSAPNVHAVVIASSTDIHADLIERSAEAGKAIFCEKPIDLDLERTKACLATIEPSRSGQSSVSARWRSRQVRPRRFTANTALRSVSVRSTYILAVSKPLTVFT